MNDMKSKQLISIVTPVFNEESNINYFFDKINHVLKRLEKKYNFELLFTDNRSTDKTFDLLKERASTDKRIRVIRFSKNFGYQKSIYTGFLLAKGDAAIQLDCDLQDPPELIETFISRWEAGSQIVYGIRQTRDENVFILFLRNLFYKFINAISQDELLERAGDFCLVDRKVLSKLHSFNDANPYLRGTIFQMGFKKTSVEYHRESRQFGKSKFSFNHMFSLAMDGIINHSILPLKLATILGVSLFFISLLLSFVYLYCKLFLDLNWPAGFTTLILADLMSLSIQSLFFGIIGEYIYRIYQQVRNQPITIIDEEV